MKSFQSRGDQYIDDSIARVNEVSEVFYREYQVSYLGYWLDVRVIAPGVVNLQYGFSSARELEPSYGVDSKFEAPLTTVNEIETESMFELKTELLIVRIRKSDLGVSFFSATTGELLSENEGGLDHAENEWTGDHRQWIKKKIRPNEHFFGLGDKPCDLNLRGKRFEIWGTDHYAFHENSDPLYKNIPFFLSLCDGYTYGIFLDNTMRCSFDFGAEREDVMVLSVPGGRMNYYFFHEDSPIKIIASYTKLTGLPDMPPLWALGYHQSRWSYYPDQIVRNVVSRMRESKIPCDAVYLDIHHMDRYESFTWDSHRFPDPKGLIDELATEGIKAVGIVNPGIKIDQESATWTSGFEGNCYCRRHDGSILEGDVWPGRCHFPDFTDPYVRRWWADCLRTSIEEVGLSGTWADMNEPVIFPDKTFPLDTRHVYDGVPCSHGKAHNIYGHCMAGSCKKGMQQVKGDRRPFVLTRSGYAGMQRFAATWTGDNCSTWEHVKMADFQCQRLSASGISFCGSDAGGFLEHPSPELFCRWMQLAAFHVFFRNHSSGEYGGQEPWSFGDRVTSAVRFAIEQRYRLLPYYYTLFYEYATQGAPIIRSVALQEWNHLDTYWRGVEFFVGAHLYVVPILNPHAGGCSLYVPEGSWFSLWDDAPLMKEEKDTWVDSPLERIPVFVRGGAVLPRWPVQQFVGELPHPELSLDLWWAAHCQVSSNLYEDAGDGMAYKEGAYLYHQFSYRSSTHGFQLSCQREGQGEEQGFHSKTLLTLHACPVGGRDVIARVDGILCKVTSGNGKTLLIELPNNFSELTLAWESSSQSQPIES